MSFELLAVRVYLSLFIPDCLSEREQGERRGKWKYAKARRRAAAERGAPEVGVETAEKRESTMLKVLCGVMQFWFDIDGQRAHIVTSSLVCCDINDFVHVARPCSSTRGSDGPA